MCPARHRAPLMTRIVVLGAGFGGLELTTRLSDEFGTDVEIVLIDKTEDFVFGFSKLDVMFGRARPDQVRHPYRDFVKPGVQFVQSTIRSIDPSPKRVETDSGTFDADVLVVALGADLHPESTPGLMEAGHDFYSVSKRLCAPRRARRFRQGAGRHRRHLDTRSSAHRRRARRRCSMDDFLKDRGIARRVSDRAGHADFRSPSRPHPTRPRPS